MAKKALTRLNRILAGARAESSEPVLESGGTRLEKFAHFWVLVWSSFVRNRCPVRAAALSYSSLLAIIPMLAVAMSVTSIFLKAEGEDRIYQFIDQLVASVMPPASLGPDDTATPTNSIPNTDSIPITTNLDLSTPGMNLVVTTNENDGTPRNAGTNAAVSSATDARVVLAQKRAAQHIHGFIQNIRGGTLGALGTVLLIFVAIGMFSRIEATFNDIWGITRGRNWFMRIMLYWTIPTLGTLLVTAALLLASGTHFQATRAIMGRMPYLSSLLFQCLPLIVVWLVFTLIYQFVPNTKVHFRAALVGGIIGGSLWHLNNLVGFLYVSRVVSNSKIYGSLGLVPVFMAGLYFSWLILLFGAQITYAFQNRKSYLQEKLAENVNQRGREFVALRLVTCIGQRFQRGLPPVTIEEMSGELGIPTRLIERVLGTLVFARLVVEVSSEGPAYAPARPLETINCHHILLAMRALQGQELVTRDEPVREEVFGEFARIQAAEKAAASSVTMLDLVNRAQARLELAPLLADPAIDSSRADEEPRTELPNEPVTATGTPPQPTETEIFEPEPPRPPRPDKDIETYRPINDPSTDDERNFPL